MSELSYGTQPCRCRRERHPTRLVVLTGGPGAGKTAVLEMARRSFCPHVAVLPEAASLVFGGGFPRHPTAAGLRAAQRVIFRVQREVERLVAEEGQAAVALCDRGTPDGLAYWPDDAESFWREMGSSLDEELRRYAAVIHLETPSWREGYNRENRLRVESAREAALIDRKIAAVWSEHPRRLLVPAGADFAAKALEALERVRDELPECCRSHPLPGETPTGGRDA